MNVNTNSSEAQRRAMKLLDLLLPFLRQHGVDDDDAIIGCTAFICGKLYLNRDLGVAEWVEKRVDDLIRDLRSRPSSVVSPRSS